MEDGDIRRPTLLGPPPSVTISKDKVRPSDLKCDWSHDIVPFTEHLRRHEGSRNVTFLILMMLFFPSLFVVLPFFYPINDFTLLLSITGAFCSILFLILGFSSVIRDLKVRDRYREQYTMTYWKPMEVSRKEVVIRDL